MGIVTSETYANQDATIANHPCMNIGIYDSVSFDKDDVNEISVISAKFVPPLGTDYTTRENKLFKNSNGDTTFDASLITYYTITFTEVTAGKVLHIKNSDPDIRLDLILATPVDADGVATCPTYSQQYGIGVVQIAPGKSITVMFNQLIEERTIDIGNEGNVVTYPNPFYTMEKLAVLNFTDLSDIYSATADNVTAKYTHNEDGTNTVSLVPLNQYKKYRTTVSGDIVSTDLAASTNIGYLVFNGTPPLTTTFKLGTADQVVGRMLLVTNESTTVTQTVKATSSDTGVTIGFGESCVLVTGLSGTDLIMKKIATFGDKRLKVPTTGTFAGTGTVKSSTTAALLNAETYFLTPSDANLIVELEAYEALHGRVLTVVNLSGANSVKIRGASGDTGITIAATKTAQVLVNNPSGTATITRVSADV